VTSEPRAGAPFRLRPRVARDAPAAWNVAKTLAQTAAMWTVFLVALPALVFRAEDALGAASHRFDPGAWRDVAVAAFVLCGACGVRCGIVLARRGEGTPLPFDTARVLVVAGPYRHVRNPMAMSSLAQGAAVGVWLGSPAVLAYAAAGTAIWNFAARPWEEADLLARFGEPYARYRRRVRCWRVRLRPYDPARESEEPPLAAERTAAPARHVVLYDGRCRLCIAASERLVRLARPGTMERRSFRDPGVLDAFPGIPAEACERAMHLVTPDGRVLAGAEAIVASLRTRPLLGAAALVYFVPGLRLTCDVLYDLVARNRLRWFGTAPHSCDDGACRG